MKKFFSLYQYAGPAILTPLAVLLWWRYYEGNWALVLLAVGVPVVHAYVVAGIGTNVLRVWAFNTRLKLGKFRPHHGFVFGSATSILALMVIGSLQVSVDTSGILKVALILGLVLALVNWIYDALAIQSGFLEVYNQPAAEGASPWVIAADYVIWFFGLFGFMYGAGLKIAEPLLAHAPSLGEISAIGLTTLFATVFLPSFCYVVTSMIFHGHCGLRPVHVIDKKRGNQS